MSLAPWLTALVLWGGGQMPAAGPPPGAEAIDLCPRVSGRLWPSQTDSEAQSEPTALPEPSRLFFGIAPGSELGWIELGQAVADVRGSSIDPGLYQLRYALRPRIKEHLAFDTPPDFALLVPRDASPSGDPNQLIADSRTLTDNGHPAILALVAQRDPVRTRALLDDPSLHLVLPTPTESESGPCRGVE